MTAPRVGIYPGTFDPIPEKLQPAEPPAIAGAPILNEFGQDFDRMSIHMLLKAQRARACIHGFESQFA
jgi:hypothetical protein